MSTFPWRPIIQTIADGEPVNAATANRPLMQLAGQNRSLKAKVDSLAPTSGRLIVSQASLGEDVLLYDFVYFDGVSGTFRPALAEAVHDAELHLVASPRSLVVGIVISINTNEPIGDILELGPLDLLAESINPQTLLDDPINSTFAEGRYFLSGRVPGKMTLRPQCPAVQLGFFTHTLCHIQPIAKDLFEQHQHESFFLEAVPAASQNRFRTGRVTLEGIERVDYYNSGETTESQQPPLLLCIRNSGAPAILESTPLRFDLYRSTYGGSNMLAIDVYADAEGAALDYYGVSSPISGSLVARAEVAWPNWGDWISMASLIPSLQNNLEIAFISSVPTAATLAATMALSSTGMTSSSRRFQIYLPNDLHGWTNANPFDPATPTGALFRYLSESNVALNASFPPVPADSAELQLNGISLKPGSDFVVNPFGVFWIPGGSYNGSSTAPWPSDYSTTSGATPAAENAKNLLLSFSRSGLSNLASVVFSLRGIAPLVVTQCPSGLPGTVGNLSISINLGLLVKSDITDSDTVLSGVSGTTFNQSYSVSELVEGKGIQITRLSSKSPRNVGKLQIAALGTDLEGDFTSIALRNAKEVWAGQILPYLEFPQPSQVASGITASFRLPTRELDLSHLSLSVTGEFLGSADVAADLVTQTAVFRTRFSIIRAGVNLGSVVPLIDQYWTLAFVANYAAKVILASEFPGNLSSLALQSGDLISLQLDRVTSASDSSAFDTYMGKVGLASLRWILQ